ncbi:hypothetical protein BaRGS_00019252, partial [Batillaria attramentaria]
INECSEDNHGCDQNCNNTVGSYICSCVDGYTLNADGRICDDIDECAEDTDGCGQNCNNTAGSYICSCRDGYTLSINNRTCDEKVSLKFEVTVAVDVDFNESDTTSASYVTVLEQAKTALLVIFRRKAPNVLEVRIIAIRKGSLIIEAEAVVAKETQETVAPTVTEALQELAATNVTIGNSTGTTSVEVDGLQVESTTEKCVVHEALGLCSEDQICEEVDGQPLCKWKESESLWRVVVGLSVGIPLCFVVAGVVFAICYKRMQGRRKSEADRHREESRVPRSRYNKTAWNPRQHRGLDPTLPPRPAAVNPGPSAWRQPPDSTHADYRDPLSFYSGLYHQTKPPSD